MKIVIVGGGSVGLAIAREVTAEGHDITIIDRDRDKTERIAAALDIMTVTGNGAALEVQNACHVGESDLLIAVSSSDEVNILSCILARKLGCRNTIARVQNPDYYEEMYLLRKELGLSMTVNPDHSAAEEVFRLLQYPGALKRDAFVKSRIEMVAVRLGEDNPLCNQKLMDLPRVLQHRIIISAVRRDRETVIPGGAFELRAGDEVFISAPVTELASILETVGLRKRRGRDVMIIGGSTMAVRVCEMLCRTGTRVKLLEKNPERCRELAERLPNVSVLCEDGTSQEALLGEDISRMDAVVTLMGLDEENVFVSMYAHLQGVSQTITKIKRQEFSEVCRNCGIQSVVNPKRTCAREVVRYVRAMQSKHSDSILSVYSLVDGEVEALEFEVPEDLPHLGEPLSKLPLRPNTLINCITRRNQVIFPRGDDHLAKGDTVIVVASARRHIVDLRDIFTAG